MSVYTLFVFVLWMRFSALQAENSTDFFNSSTIISVNAEYSNNSFEENATLYISQETNFQNFTTFESTSLTSNLLSSPTNDSVNLPSTNATELEEQEWTSSTGSTLKLHSEASTEKYFASTLPESSSTETPTTIQILISTTVKTEVLMNKSSLQVNVPMPTVSRVADNITSLQELIERNEIVLTNTKTSTDSGDIVVGHKCTKIFQDSILWNDTDGGMLALKTCSSGYQGNMYRPCFTSGKWGNVDYSECRLEHLGRMRHMIFHQVQKGMLGNMYSLVEDFSKYLSSVDMKSPMDRLEAFEILNTFLKLDMNLKLDKSRDTNYIQTLLHSCNELIKKKSVSFPPGSQKNQLITQKAIEMIFHLTHFAERTLRGLLKTQKKQVVFKSIPNVAMHLYRGKLSGQLTSMNFSDEHRGSDATYASLETTLERSAYALIWITGLRELLSTNKYLVNSDISITTIVSPLNSLNHMLHPPTFDVGLRIEKEVPEGFILKCGQLWNLTELWNTKDCTKVSVKQDIITCRCRHLGSIALLLEDQPNTKRLISESPMGTMVSISCITSLCLLIFTFFVNFLLKRSEVNFSVFILINILITMGAIQLFFLFGVSSTAHFEICMSVALFLHYLFLVLCFWVVSYGVYLLKKLRTAAEYVGNIRDYCAACWILPLILLVISFVANPEGYEARQYCWLNIRRGILWSFVVPVTGLIMVNTIVMLLSLKTFNEQMSVTHRAEICRIRNSLRAGITLLPVFAINWFFGLFAVEDSRNVGLQIIFSLTNSIQSIMTFVFFCVMDNHIQLTFRLKFAVAQKKPKISAMKLRKSGSFPIFDRGLLSLADENRRMDCTPLLAGRTAYHDTTEDPCCSNIRV